MTARVKSAVNSRRHLSKQTNLLLASAAVIVSLSAWAASSYAQIASQPVYEFANGRWFDGQTFRLQTWFSVAGVLTAHRPPKIDTVVDLKGGFVVPPFGDAHNHNFNSPRTIARELESYLHDGIYYSMVMGDIRSGAMAVSGQINTSTSVDVRYAHGVLTGAYSHPAISYEARELGYFGREQEEAHTTEIRQSHKLKNDAYYIVDTETDLENKWPAIVSGKPDFLKIILLHSEDFESRKSAHGNGMGIDPKLVPSIVAKAHAAGLRVAAHVDSAFDYHTALTAGVDIMAHLPGYYFRPQDEGHIEEVYALSVQDIRDTAAKHIAVVPTANWSDWENSYPLKAQIRAMQSRNLRLLKQAGVTFAIGTDSFGLDSLREAFYLETFCIFTNLELLKMWSEDTPRLIFPNRKIGYFREGYEASFLVLKGNPIEHFEATLDIMKKFKQGHELVARDPIPQTEPPSH